MPNWTLPEVADLPYGQVVAARDTLKRAKKVILKKGWTKHALKNDLGQVCAVGALVEADGPGQSLARTLLLRAIYTNTEFTTIEDWNDDAARRKGNVIAAFNRLLSLFD